MGSKGGGGTDWNEQAYGNAYNAAAGGQDLGTVLRNSSGYEDAAKAGYSAYGGSSSSSGSSGLSFETMMAQSAADSQAQIDANNAANAAAQAAAERAAYEGQIDQLYTSKFAAANQATESVNQSIAEEAGYARVGGADYAISEAEKAERINNKFSSYWSSEQESTLAGLEKNWGSSGNKWTSGIVRGVVSEEDAADLEGDSAGGAVNPSRVFGVTGSEDDEDKLGGANTTLGSV